MFPRARTEELLIREVEAEVLVYDQRNHGVHCLNPTAALIWRHCNGTRTVAQLAELASGEAGFPEAAEEREAFVWHALQGLASADLMDAAPRPPEGDLGLSRRELGRSLAAGAVGVLLPAVLSITAPTAAEAASCLESGKSCTSHAQCCNQLCDGSTCV